MTTVAATWTLRLDGDPTTLALSTDGALAAIGRADGGIELIEVDTGRPRSALASHADAIADLAWHPHARRLASSGHDGVVRVHALDAPAVTVVPAGARWVGPLAWHPRGNLLAVARGKEVTVHDLRGRPARGPIALAATIEGLAWSPDGRSLAAACYGGVHLLDPVAGRTARTLATKSSLLSVAWRPDGAVIAAGCQDHSVHFWRLPSGKDAEMTGYPGKPRELAWTADGRWLATGGGPQVCLWPFDGRGPEGREPLELAGHDAPITGIASAPLVNLLLSGDRAGRVCVWAPPDLRRPLATCELGDRVVTVRWAASAATARVAWVAVAADGALAGGALA